MKTDLYNLKAEKIGQITLPKSVFEADFSPQLISQMVRNYLSNQRSSGAKVKNRSEVAGTTKKMWAQKGTGRARHGSAKAPIFVGGGSAHGPQGDRNYKRQINKSANKTSVKSILSAFAKDKKIMVIDKISPILPKTKTGVKLLQALKINGKVGIITRDPQANVSRAFNNLSDVTLINLHSLNAYQLSSQNSLIISQSAVKQLAKR